MNNPRKGTGYTFTIFDLDGRENDVYLDVEINQIEGLFTDTYLFSTFAELIVKLEIEGYGVMVRERGDQYDE